MTRYARGKGSKASNERLPNEPTPWHVMKQQIEENRNKEPLEKKKGAKELLKDQENMFDNNTNGNTWAEFEDNNSKSNKKKKLKNFKTNKNDTNLTKPFQNNGIVTPENNKNTKKLQKTEDTTNTTDSKTNKISKIKKRDIEESLSIEEKSSILQNEACSNSNMLSKREKRNLKRTLKMSDNESNDIVTYENNNTKKLRKTEDTTNTTDGKTNKISKKKKRDIEESLPVEEKSSISQNEASSNFNMLSKRQKRNLNRKLKMSGNESKKFKQGVSSQNAFNKEKEQKIKRKTEYKRRKPDVGATKMIINGVEIEIVKFDGFPIKKEDATRLTELKQKLIMKGIPKSEVDTAIKLERRKAEKALTRVKKLVCFNCRKSGHNLSDCPELDREETSTGICFKCGSTEHTHFECKVNRETTYRFAKCFICREQGHIAMQCPDNPKGVYPHGGCCKICGDVTHLKKDCPDLVNAKEDNVVTVEKMDNSAVESLQEDVKEKSVSNQQPKNKIVKF